MKRTLITVLVALSLLAVLFAGATAQTFYTSLDHVIAKSLITSGDTSVTGNLAVTGVTAMTGNTSVGGCPRCANGWCVRDASQHVGQHHYDHRHDRRSFGRKCGARAMGHADDCWIRK